MEGAQRIFIGRQTIFDRKMDTYAYELLYRDGETPGAGEFDGDRASSCVLLNTFLEIGLERLTGPHPAFINLTRNFFVDLPPIPFDRSRVVLEILENIEVDDSLINRVAELAEQGYRLAIDDYGFEPKWEPLLPLVHIVKVEVAAIDWENIETQLRHLRRHKVRLLAEKVETREQFEQLHEAGFDYFQGYYFCRPQLVSGKRLGENHLVLLQLLAKLNDPAATTSQLEQLIIQDASLSYKMLRYLNSAAVALPQKIDNIGQAIVYLGLDRIRAWASLMTMSKVENRPRQIFINALVRANMCEALIRCKEPEKAQTAFTAGLLSILDLLMDQPLEPILERLPINQELQDALLHHRGLIGSALRCSLAFEFHRWDEAQMDGVVPARAEEIYLEASSLAFQSLAI